MAAVFPVHIDRPLEHSCANTNARLERWTFSCDAICFKELYLLTQPFVLVLVVKGNVFTYEPHDSPGIIAYPFNGRKKWI